MAEIGRIIMRITKRQLRRLIREEAGRVWSYGPSGQILDPEEEYQPEDEKEYKRGYEDGLDNYPVADDATHDYDAGYEDGKLDADKPETDIRDIRSKDW
jgi:hypothetical protein